MPPDPLNAESIRRALRRPDVQVAVLARCASTNSQLLGDPRPGVRLLAAERQTAGRGRRGRRWRSRHGVDLTFSLALTFTRALRELPALSLVAGAAVRRALRALGARRVRLKWPNDLLAGHAKLGGILIETRSLASGTLAVIGVGLNWRGAGELSRRVHRPVAALEDLLRPLPSRNRVLGCVADALLADAARFEAAAR